MAAAMRSISRTGSLFFYLFNDVGVLNSAESSGSPLENEAAMPKWAGA